MELELCLKRSFSAAHCLSPEGMSEEDKESTYGACKHVHGHTWDVEVKIVGKPDPRTGMIINFNEVKSVIDGLDHGTVNDYVELPTAENLVVYFINHIRELGSFSKVQVTVWEAKNSSIKGSWESC